MTNDLKRRLYEHTEGLADGFTQKYHVHKLVYFEVTTDVRSAIAREKQIKGWTRAKKNALDNCAKSAAEEIIDKLRGKGLL